MKRQYSVIVADPPWKFDDKLTMSRVKRGGDANYCGTMTVSQLCELPINQILDSEYSILVLWYASGFRHAADEVMRAWGFEYKQEWVWVKTGVKENRTEGSSIPGDIKLKFGMGRLARYCHEMMLVGVRGRVYNHLRNHSQRTVFLAEPPPKRKVYIPKIGRHLLVGTHSSKPEKVQDAIDLMFPDGHKIELFARRQRLGWRCIGNEAPATYGEDITRTLRRIINGTRE